MLHIILTILKIIGIIVLAILGFIIFLVVCVLFSPIKYKTDISYYEKLKIRAKISYLLGAVSLTYDKEYENPLVLRIFGIKTNYFNKAEKEKFDKDTEMFEEMAKEKSSSKANIKNTDNDTQTNDINTENEFLEKKSLFQKIIDKIKAIISKIKYLFKKICGTIKKAFSSVTNMIEFLGEDSTKEAFSLLKNEIITLLKHIKPRKIKGHIHFGFEDPSITGKLLGAIYAITKGGSKYFLINPDFENKIIEGEIHAKGRIYVFKLLLIVWHVYKNENFKKSVLKRRT